MQRKMLNVVVIGHKQVGKTTLINLLKDAMQEGVQNASNVQVVKPYDAVYQLNLIEVSASIAKDHIYTMKVAHAVLVLYRIDDRQSYDEAQNVMRLMRNTEKDHDVPMVLLGTHRDLPTVIRQVTEKTARESSLERDNDALLYAPNDHFHEISLVTNENIPHMLKNVLEVAIERFKEDQASFSSRVLAKIDRAAPPGSKLRKGILIVAGAILVGILGHFSIPLAIGSTVVTAGGYIYVKKQKAASNKATKLEVNENAELLDESDIANLLDDDEPLLDSRESLSPRIPRALTDPEVDLIDIMLEPAQAMDESVIKLYVEKRETLSTSQALSVMQLAKQTHNVKPKQEYYAEEVLSELNVWNRIMLPFNLYSSSPFVQFSAKPLIQHLQLGVGPVLTPTPVSSI